ncbi:hypothetical protein B0H17DRAFT_1204605 [Mycena rosella]|uniref:Uncharacterized protein n=1 Tax=Mycena rosella TaxID=1033263 RepID=A0AAD7CMG3_MYCRO|nr:hypothetical protein B0H17DRAFT_1214744 [Mycena rosella]KAJ7685914.1 hypothetical protein B0H17DRAFT_1204605 [Mycena rosella]
MPFFLGRTFSLLCIAAQLSLALPQDGGLISRQAAACTTECQPLQTALSAGGLANTCTQDVVNDYETCFGCKVAGGGMSQAAAQSGFDAFAKSCQDGGHPINSITITPTDGSGGATAPGAASAPASSATGASAGTPAGTAPAGGSPSTPPSAASDPGAPAGTGTASDTAPSATGASAGAPAGTAPAGGKPSSTDAPPTTPTTGGVARRWGEATFVAPAFVLVIMSALFVS